MGANADVMYVNNFIYLLNFIFISCFSVPGSPILTISDVPADRAYTLKYPFEEIIYRRIINLPKAIVCQPDTFLC